MWATETSTERAEAGTGAFLYGQPEEQPGGNLGRVSRSSRPRQTTRFKPGVKAVHDGRLTRTACTAE